MSGCSPSAAPPARAAHPPLPCANEGLTPGRPPDVGTSSMTSTRGQRTANPARRSPSFTLGSPTPTPPSDVADDDDAL